MPGFSKLTLQPKNYALHVLRRLDMLRKDRTLCDCTLRVDGREFPVHKCFLSASSPYFKALFTSQLKENGSSVIEIGGVSSTTFENVLDFMYQGRISLTDENITEIFPASHLLQVQELREVCCDYFLNQLCSSNCLGIWKYARSYSSARVEDSAWCYITRNFADIVTTSDELKSLSKEELVMILASDDLDIETEADAHAAVLSWLFHDLEERRQHLADVLSHVRLPLLSSQSLSSLASSSQLLAVDRSCKEALVQARNAQRLRSTKSRQKKVPAFKEQSLTPRKSSKKLVVAGGYCAGFVKRCETLNDDSGSWSEIDLPLLSSKELFWVGVIGTRLYALGGDAVMNINQVLSKFTSKAASRLCSGAFTTDWEVEATLLYDCSGSQVCILNECIYTLGEVTLDDIPVYGISCYNPSSGTWEFLTTLSQSRVSAGFTAHGGRLYLAGGLDPHSGAALKTLEAFNPTTRTWEAFPSCHTGRYHAGAVILDDNLYLIGGNGDTRSEIDVVLDSVECFSFATKKWSFAGHLNAPRAGMAACVWKGKVYAIGGECTDSNHSGLVESYDCSSGKWTVLSSLQNERIYPNIVVL